MTNGVDFFRKVDWLDTHFEEEKEHLIGKIKRTVSEAVPGRSY